MEITLDQMRRKNSLKKILRSLSFEEVEKVQATVAEYLEEVAVERAAQEAEMAQKQAAIDNVKALMKESGISVDELTALAKDLPTNSRSVVKPKYRKEVNGETFEWSGRGRSPKWVEEHIAQGGTKEELAI